MSAMLFPGWDVRFLLLGLGATCMLQGCGSNGGDMAPDIIKGGEDIMSQKAHGTCVAAPKQPLRWNADYETADRISCFNRHYAEFAGSWESTGLPADIASQEPGSAITFYDVVTGEGCYILCLAGPPPSHPPRHLPQPLALDLRGHRRASTVSGRHSGRRWTSAVGTTGPEPRAPDRGGHHRKPLFVAPKGRSWEDFNQESQSHGWPSFRDEEVITDYVRVLPDGEAVSVDGTHLGHNLPDNKGNRYCINLVSVAAMPPE
ncbi:unnamed protein product [Durusdinium trenchii]|uniref:Peptide-methionine (R)-S-oxide reductase n=1 Tax=Durusdinium trenchii TaxID=1381693 RepID=A0ABP0HAY2_9DINO